MNDSDKKVRIVSIVKLIMMVDLHEGKCQVCEKEKR